MAWAEDPEDYVFVGLGGVGTRFFSFCLAALTLGPVTKLVEVDARFFRLCPLLLRCLFRFFLFFLLSSELLVSGGALLLFPLPSSCANSPSTSTPPWRTLQVSLGWMPQLV